MVDWIEADDNKACSRCCMAEHLISLNNLNGIPCFVVILQCTFMYAALENLKVPSPLLSRQHINSEQRGAFLGILAS